MNLRQALTRPINSDEAPALPWAGETPDELDDLPELPELEWPVEKEARALAGDVHCTYAQAFALCRRDFEAEQEAHELQEV